MTQKEKTVKDLGYARKRLKEMIKNNYKPSCDHEFVHVSKGWWGCETVIYCKHCGHGTLLK